MANQEYFIESLVKLLTIAEKGMLVLDEPLPDGIVEQIGNTVASFGARALPLLHRVLMDDLKTLDPKEYRNNSGYIIDVIGKISDPSSVPILVKYHKEGPINYSNSAAILGALRAIASEEAYKYLGTVLNEYASGNIGVIESSLDLQIACYAMAEWQSNLSIDYLKSAAQIDEWNQVQEYAIDILGSYSDARKYLEDLAKQKPHVREIVINALRDNSV